MTVEERGMELVFTKAYVLVAGVAYVALLAFGGAQYRSCRADVPAWPGCWFVVLWAVADGAVLALLWPLALLVGAVGGVLWWVGVVP